MAHPVGGRCDATQTFVSDPGKPEGKRLRLRSSDGWIDFRDSSGPSLAELSSCASCCCSLLALHP